MNIVLTKRGDPIEVAARRARNDAFRQSLTGGTVMLSAGVIAFGASNQARIIAAVRACTFDTDDPFDDHSIGDLEVAGHRIFFKLDYYDPTMSFLSDDPADPAKTVRVITIMLADEY